MSQNIVFNGVVYSVPAVGDDSWGQSLSDYLIAIPQGALQKSGGIFTLSADVNLGANYGILSKYFSTRTVLPAQSGILRLSLADTIAWRNNANSADLSLSIDGSDRLVFNGGALTSGGITSLTGDVTATGPGSVAAAIANNAVTNAKFRQSTALSLVGNSTNALSDVADIVAGSDFTLLMRSGTSLVFNLLTNNNIDPAAAIAYSKLTLTGAIVNADVSASAAIALSKLATIATATILGRTTAGTGAIESLTATQATAILNAFVGDSGSGGTKGLVPAPATGDAAAGKVLKADGSWGAAGTASPLTTKGDLYGYSTANDRLPVGSNGSVLVADSTQSLGVKWAGVTTLQPTVQKFTSGSGTYTTPTGALYIRVRMVGGGGGSSGSGSTSSTGMTAGGNTTFGSSLLVANGGGAGGTGGNPVRGAGGSASLGSGPIGTALNGGDGQTGGGGPLAEYSIGGIGGSSFFGGAGAGGYPNQAGQPGYANTGGGGGGGSTNNTVSTGAGGGGGAGGYLDAIITSPSATYSYAVGAGGTGGSAGTNGAGGAAGGSGYIEVTEYYQNYAASTSSAVAAGTFLAGPTSGSAATPTFRALQPPTIQKFTSGSGTYTKATGALYLRVRMVGGGGGGAGSGSGTPPVGGAGGQTIFGPMTADGGTGGQSGGGAGGNGGGASLGSGPIGTTMAGSSGNAGYGNASVVGLYFPGTIGGVSFFGGAGGAGTAGGTGRLAEANSGSGGGGAGTNNISPANVGSSGGAGGYLDAIITSPSASYSYAIGAAGSAGGAGSGGQAGGAGGAGYIEVTEYYQ